MITRTACIALLALLLLPSAPADAQKKVGTTAAPFLGIGVGPRAAAMGGAFVAHASDVSALYWNPGAVSRPGRSQVMAAHTSWLVETSYNWVGLQLALDESNAIGISLIQLDYGEDRVTSVTQPDGTGERWSAQDLAIGVSYARNLTDRFSLGGSVKYITQRIWNESASAFAADIGLLFITPFDDLRLGMSLSNFGTSMQLDGKDLVQRIDLDPGSTGTNKTIVASLKTDSWDLPLFFRVGVAYDLVRNDLFTVTTALDAVRPNDNDEYLNAGCELAYRDLFYVRAGYKTLFLSDSEEGFTAGLGVNYPLFGSTAASIDYTYQEFGVFKNVQTITFGVTF
jgi:opacity protein-like surface antigen